MRLSYLRRPRRRLKTNYDDDDDICRVPLAPINYVMNPEIIIIISASLVIVTELGHYKSLPNYLCLSDPIVISLERISYYYYYYYFRFVARGAVYKHVNERLLNLWRERRGRQTKNVLEQVFSHLVCGAFDS